MYIQPTPEDTIPERTVPQGYSGTTFTAEAQAAPVLEEERSTVSAHEEESVKEEKKEKESVPTLGRNVGKRGDFFGKKGFGGLLSEFPLLSSLLPPPRSHTHEQSDLMQWILIGGAILLFLNDSTDDILPLLLLLLLWD